MKNIQTSMVGRRIRVGVSLEQITEKLLPLSQEERKKFKAGTMVHGVNDTYAGMEGVVVTVYQDGDKNIRYTTEVGGKLIDFYTNEFDVIP